MSCRAYFEEDEGKWRRRWPRRERLQATRTGGITQQRWKQAIMAAAEAKSGRRMNPADAVLAWLREVFWPYRHAWAGMAAVWLALWVVNSGMSPAPNAAMSAFIKTTTNGISGHRGERQTLLAEKLLPPATPEPAEKPKVDTRPRGQKQADLVLLNSPAFMVPH